MSAKSRIAFVLPSMASGGVSKMLLDILNSINIASFDVDILLLRQEGEKLDQLPKGMTVKQLNGINRWEGLRRDSSATLNRLGLKRLFRLLKMFYHRFGYLIIQNQKRRTTYSYDVVVAFQDGLATWYTAKNINGKYKFAVVHTDFKQVGYDVVAEKKQYDSFEQIYCTSATARTSFLLCLPEFSNRTKILLPLVDSTEIYEKAKLTNDTGMLSEGINIVTVARLSHEKGIDIALQVLSKLLADGYSIKWFFIGDGTERDTLEKISKKLNCMGSAVFMGAQSNPYTVMAMADIYVQPSRYESYCIALAEAMALGRAIVTTNFSGAQEQLGSSGGIIAGISADSLYKGVKLLIDNPETRNQFASQSRLLFSQRIPTDNVLLEDINEYMKRGHLT